MTPKKQIEKNAGRRFSYGDKKISERFRSRVAEIMKEQRVDLGEAMKLSMAEMIRTHRHS